MAKIENIVGAFDAERPAIAADFTAYIRRQFERIVGRYDAQSLRALGNDWGGDAGIWRLVRKFSRHEGGRPGGALSIDAVALDRAAAAYARAQVQGFTAKLSRKLCDLDNVAIQKLDGTTFAITGEIGGRFVRVEQTQVLKSSSKGKPFHQWPARIWVDGKFMPEAAFKRLTTRSCPGKIPRVRPGSCRCQ